MASRKELINNPSSVEKLSSIQLGSTTPLKLLVWRIRRGIRNILSGNDILVVDDAKQTSKHTAREIYRGVNSFVSRHLPRLIKDTPIDVARKMVQDQIDHLDYSIVEQDLTKPWGAYYRMDSSQAQRFIEEFFPGLSLSEAMLGRDDVELSPKILLVAPGHRLSWQYHDRRAERWRFLTPGAYYRSHSDELPNHLIQAEAGEVVQFDAGERHRLGSHPYSKGYTLVAEIWQHTHKQKPSDESDIVRLQDDYHR